MQAIVEMNRQAASAETLGGRLKSFFTPFDARFEDLTKGNWKLNA